MKKLIAVSLLLIAGVASAACPTYAPYRCVDAGNGKMRCGCGV